MCCRDIPRCENVIKNIRRLPHETWVIKTNKIKKHCTKNENSKYFIYTVNSVKHSPYHFFFTKLEILLFSNCTGSCLRFSFKN